MAISKDKKQQLIKQYVEDLQTASNVVIVQQTGLSVNTSTEVRRGIL